MVIFVVTGNRLQIAVAALAHVLKAFLEQEKLQLGRHDRRQPKFLQTRDLRFQHGARGMRHFLVGVVIEDIAHHHGRAFQPRHPPQGGKIRFHDIVAVPAGPARRRIAFDRVHLKVGCQQIVAAMGLVIGTVDEMLGVETLAHQPSLHVDDTGQHRVDLAG